MVAMVLVEVAGEDDGCELESAIEGRRTIYLSTKSRRCNFDAPKPKRVPPKAGL